MNKRRVWTDEEVRRLKQMVDAGGKDIEIAETLQRSLHSIRQQRKRSVSSKSMGRPSNIPPEFLEVAFHSTSDLALRFCRTENTIRAWRRRIGAGDFKVSQKIEVPPDFLERWPEHSMASLAAHYGVCIETIRRLRDDLGLETRNTQIPVPDDFDEIAPTMQYDQLCHHYGRSKWTIGRWLRERGIVRRPAPAPVPDNFDDLARILPTSALCERFGMSEKRIRRLRLQRGIPSPASENRKIPRIERPGRAVISTSGDGSMASLAANHLRKIGYVPVCRSKTINQKSDPDEWVVGRNRMPSADMIALARNKNWRPDEWREIAK